MNGQVSRMLHTANEADFKTERKMCECERGTEKEMAGVTSWDTESKGQSLGPQSVDRGPSPGTEKNLRSHVPLTAAASQSLTTSLYCQPAGNTRDLGQLLTSLANEYLTENYCHMRTK